MNRFPLFPLLLVILIAHYLYGADPKAVTPPEKPPQKLTGTLPFTLHQGYVIVVQGSIGSRKNLNFMVETGARPTVIDVRRARHLGISGKQGDMALSNMNVPIQYAECPSMEIGPLHRTQQPVVVGDLTKLKAHLGMPIDALIGLDVLGQSNFTIDYEHKEIVFGASETPASIAYETDGALAIVPLRVGGKPLRVLMDTGAPGLLLFRSGAKMSGVKYLRGQDMRNMGGWMRVDLVTIDDVVLGNRKLGTTSAAISGDQPKGANFDGVLGPSSLHLKRLTFDVEHHLFGWAQ